MVFRNRRKIENIFLFCLKKKRRKIRQLKRIGCTKAQTRRSCLQRQGLATIALIAGIIASRGVSKFVLVVLWSLFSFYSFVGYLPVDASFGLPTIRACPSANKMTIFTLDFIFFFFIHIPMEILIFFFSI